MKALLAMLGVSAMIGLSAPAQAVTTAGADPDNTAFLTSLQASGITYRSADQAVTAARTLCALVGRGEPGLDALRDLKANNPGFSTDGAARFAMIAAHSYCPEQLAPRRDGNA